MKTLLGVDPSYRNFAMVLADWIDERLTNLRFSLTDAKEADKQHAKKQGHVDVLSANSLVNLFGEADAQADVVIAECPTGSQSAKAAKYSGMMMGVLGGFRDKLILLTPTEIKRGFTGNPKASKREMIERAVELHPEAPWRRRGNRILNINEHFADAIGALYVGSKRYLTDNGIYRNLPGTLSWES